MPNDKEVREILNELVDVIAKPKGKLLQATWGLINSLKDIHGLKFISATLEGLVGATNLKNTLKAFRDRLPRLLILEDKLRKFAALQEEIKHIDDAIRGNTDLELRRREHASSIASKVRLLQKELEDLEFLGSQSGIDDVARREIQKLRANCDTVLDGLGDNLKLTIYFWPNANSISFPTKFGFGHIACSIQEKGGKKRQMFVTPGFLQGLGKRTERAALLPDLIRQGRIKDAEQYLPLEFQAFDSRNVIRIQMPVSEVTFDQFVSRFQKTAKDNLTREYSYFSNNCAHLTSKVLSVAYPNDARLRNPLTNTALLPRTVLSNAVSLLGEEEVKRTNHLAIVATTDVSGSISDEQLVTGDIAIISKYQFSLEMTKVLLHGLHDINPPDPQLMKAIEDFRDTLDAKPIDDVPIANAFSNMNEQIMRIEKSLLSKYYKTPEKRTFINDAIETLKTLKYYLYGFIRIFSKNPDLEMLRGFKQIVEKTVSKIEKSLALKTEEAPVVPGPIIGAISST